MKILVLFVLVALVGLTPACRYDIVKGQWRFYESERSNSHTENCDTMGDVVYTKQFDLQFPDIVVDELGNYGTWTLVGNAGFEININERSYFSYFAYGESTVNCGETNIGWSRDTTVRNWSCYFGQKINSLTESTILKPTTPLPSGKFVNNIELINKINTVQSLWKAKAYLQHEQYTREEMIRRAGGPATHWVKLPSSAPVTAKQKARGDFLPASFDWRNVSGVNYVSPVRDQEACGSCYIFASMGSLEARIRIYSANERQDIFSPQDVIECTRLGSGCSGGWPYVIGGRYAEEQGVVAEVCNPYTAVDGPCSTNATCSRTYVSEYEYVGGYYGACNEELMKEALVTEGPIVVDFMVYDDFFYYEGGVYQHTQLKDNSFHPYENVNHAVVIVGYGIDEISGEKFWSVKNSWGDWFGEDGYFRILRGTDECSIEAAGMSPIPIQ